MKIVAGNIVAPQGFLAAGNHVGVKKFKKDMAFIVSECPAVCAGAFTKSLVKAAPVVRNKAIVKNGGLVKGIVIVSGNANACTGKQGEADDRLLAEYFAKKISAQPEEVLTATTGIIGLPMPMDTILKGIDDTLPLLGNKPDNGMDALKGIITTDTTDKHMAVEISIDNKPVTIGAISKGSGMIHPNMATVLTFLTTDLNISQELLQKALLSVVDKTYNMTSVDGDTSTNDMVLILANGKSGNTKIETEDEGYHLFLDALYQINEKMAKEIVRDGEGATKLMEVHVTGAKSPQDAAKIAKSIITSNLVKTALYGEDANWGRIVAAMGYSGAWFDNERMGIAFQTGEKQIQLMENGAPVAFSENIAAKILSEEEILIHIQLQDGGGEARAWGCDLGHEYIRINGEYRVKT